MLMIRMLLVVFIVEAFPSKYFAQPGFPKIIADLPANHTFYTYGERIGNTLREVRYIGPYTDTLHLKEEKSLVSEYKFSVKEGLFIVTSVLC